MEIPELVTPLCDNSKGVLEERDYDEETTDRGEVRPEGLRVDLDGIFDLFSPNPHLLERVVWVGGSVT